MCLLMYYFYGCLKFVVIQVQSKRQAGLKESVTRSLTQGIQACVMEVEVVYTYSQQVITHNSILCDRNAFNSFNSIITHNALQVPADIGALRLNSYF